MVYTSHRRSTIVSLETYPYVHGVSIKEFVRKILPIFIFTTVFFISLAESLQSPGEFEKELELLTSLTVKEANLNPLLNNAISNQSTCQCRKKMNRVKTRSVSQSSSPDRILWELIRAFHELLWQLFDNFLHFEQGAAFLHSEQFLVFYQF